MTSKLMQCDDGQLLAMLRTDASIAEQQPVIDHVEGCARCQSRLVELAAYDDDWRNAAAALSSTSDADKAMDIELEQTVLPRFSRWTDRSSEWNESIVKQLLDPPSHPEMLGRLGRYEIECLIGSGGMGIVFKAYDTELHRPVAIKMLAPYLASSGSARQRFAREARSAAGIIDDHVVPIHNVESEHQPPFLVMQYVAGGSLQEKLDRHGPLDVVEIVRIGVQTAKGLAAAHAQGLIHRDVKPSNILLDEGVERALLTDFGLARTQDDACLTRSGFQPGTPHYMSPEQVRGETLDARSDLFSLGCVLYALCTGRPPFRADSGYAVLRRITDDTPRPIREINSAIPEWLEQIVMKLLEKDREQRFGSAEEVANTLSQWLAHVQQPHVVPAPAALKPATSNQSGDKSRWMKYLMGAAASLLLLFAGIVIVLETGKGTIRIESEADGVPIRITQGEHVVDSLTVSKSGAGVRVSAGEYVVQIDGQFSGVDVLDGVVTIDRGEQKVIRIVQSHSPEAPLVKFGGIRITDEMCRIRGNCSAAGTLVIELQNSFDTGADRQTIAIPTGAFDVEFRPGSPAGVIGEEMNEVRMVVMAEGVKPTEQVISSDGFTGRGGKLKIRNGFGDEGPIRHPESLHFADILLDDGSKLPVSLVFQPAELDVYVRELSIKAPREESRALNPARLKVASVSENEIKLVGSTSQPMEVVLSIPDTKGEELEWKSSVSGDFILQFAKGEVSVDGGTVEGAIFTNVPGAIFTNISGTNYLVFDGNPIPAGDIRIIDVTEGKVSNTPMIIAEIIRDGEKPIPISIELQNPFAAEVDEQTGAAIEGNWRRKSTAGPANQEDYGLKLPGGDEDYGQEHPDFVIFGQRTVRFIWEGGKDRAEVGAYDLRENGAIVVQAFRDDALTDIFLGRVQVEKNRLYLAMNIPFFPDGSEFPEQAKAESPEKTQQDVLYYVYDREPWTDADRQESRLLDERVPPIVESVGAVPASPNANTLLSSGIKPSEFVQRWGINSPEYRNTLDKVAVAEAKLEQL